MTNKIKLRVAFGTDLVNKLEDGELNLNDLNIGSYLNIGDYLMSVEGEIKELEFNTQEEVNAYLQGCSDTDGWGAYYIEQAN